MTSEAEVVKVPVSDSSEAEQPETERVEERPAQLETIEELKQQVVKFLGKTVKPKEIKFVAALPKTRSAKIVRGVIKRKYLGQELGDIASVENPDAIEEIAKAR